MGLDADDRNAKPGFVFPSTFASRRYRCSNGTLFAVCLN
jgi:hypothetical protein